MNKKIPVSFEWIEWDSATNILQNNSSKYNQRLFTNATDHIHTGKNSDLPAPENTDGLEEKEIMSSSGTPISTQQHEIVSEVLAALESDQLDLPVLPEMVIKIKALIDDPESTSSQFVQLISSDLAISLYLIKAANSAAFSTGLPVGSLHGAISRLGYRMLYSMVMNITLTKLFNANSQLINQKLKELWERSRIVAANSYVLAQKKKYLKPEDAMLAGLVHEIGALPLYLYADRHYPEIDMQSLDILISTFSAPICLRLLQCWNFPKELIDVVTNSADMRKTTQTEQANYLDVVTMANLQMQSNSRTVEWRNVFAAERLGYYPGDCKNFFANHAEQFSAVSGMLGIGAS